MTLDLRLKTKMDDSTKERLDEPTFDADMEELKQQWTLEQLELSKRVSEVLLMMRINQLYLYFLG